MCDNGNSNDSNTALFKIFHWSCVLSYIWNKLIMNSNQNWVFASVDRFGSFLEAQSFYLYSFLSETFKSSLFLSLFLEDQFFKRIFVVSSDLKSFTQSFPQDGFVVADFKLNWVSFVMRFWYGWNLVGQSNKNISY